MSAPDSVPRSGVARPALIRFSLLVLLLAGGWVAYRFTPLGDLVTEAHLVERLDQLADTPWVAPALVGLWTLLSPLGVPASPLVIATSAIFGLPWGWVWNFTGCMLGAVASFLIGRALGRDLIAQLLGPRRVARVEGLLARHGFLAMVRSRLIPIPFALINYGAALAGYRLGPFALATALGSAPSLLVYTYFFERLVRGTAAARPGLLRDLLLATVLLLLLSFLPAILRRSGGD